MKILKRLVLRPALKLLKLILNPMGYEVVRSSELVDYYLHEYPSYENYRDVQILHSKRKIESIWADEATLKRWRIWSWRAAMVT